ncbi:hypothetical protein PSTT_06653 [Puccinia striiformis]|uniref:Hydrophobin n=1 Tax=Puccinia striiformis TaxID=27350 RepID=A0A2S4VJB6_9BASI|nr:hypothetical protein PSTT_06653 [Puccinia striiformis]
MNFLQLFVFMSGAITPVVMAAGTRAQAAGRGQQNQPKTTPGNFPCTGTLNAGWCVSAILPDSSLGARYFVKAKGANPNFSCNGAAQPNKACCKSNFAPDRNGVSSTLNVDFCKIL